MKTLARPVYVVYNTAGSLTELYCKLCGTQIAGIVGKRFVRFPDYVELKFSVSDTAKHVTNLCKTCVVEADAPETLQLLYEADLDLIFPQREDAGIKAALKTLRPRRIQKLDFSQKGLV